MKTAIKRVERDKKNKVLDVGKRISTTSFWEKNIKKFISSSRGHDIKMSNYIVLFGKLQEQIEVIEFFWNWSNNGFSQNYFGITI